MHEKTLQTRPVYKGKIFDVEVLDVQLENGIKAIREVVRHPGSVAILARHPDGRFALVRQYRKGVEREMLEIVAGTREPGEDVELCAHRELKEESGYAAARLTHWGTICPSPGFVDEKIELFFAELEPSAGDQQPDEDENLEVVFLRKDEIVRLIAENRIQDAKTLAAWAVYICRMAQQEEGAR